jgi:hypothetical protein
VTWKGKLCELSEENIPWGESKREMKVKRKGQGNVEA